MAECLYAQFREERGTAKGVDSREERKLGQKYQTRREKMMGAIK
jgi:hypothetical protein